MLIHVVTATDRFPEVAAAAAVVGEQRPGFALSALRARLSFPTQRRTHESRVIFLKLG